ncbi:ATP synthase epsilon chain [hydrothermal vent metagenome]|uniref:ATP synthase epsilon chain n=1 Tax=hydrothermal vent metagenome TaxID=652676 RepID=A0A1W1BT05_9ZZZZ
MDTFTLEILTPNGQIFEGSVVSVTLPGEEGEFGVLAHHASLTTLLTSGVIDITKEDKSEESVLINWGVVQVDEEKVVVLVEGAVAIRGENEGEVSKSLQEAQELLKDIADSGVAIASASAKIESVAKNLL